MQCQLPNRAKQAKAKVKAQSKELPERSILTSSINYSFKNTHLISQSLSLCLCLSLSLSLSLSMDSFAWTSVCQAAGLAGGSAVVSDRRAGGLLPPPMLGLQLQAPAGLEHFMDPGLVQLAMRSSCFAAANGAPTASPSYITSEEHPLQPTTGSGNGEPGFGGGGDAPSAEACSSRAPEADSNSKKSKRSNEVVAYCSLRLQC
jgi:hypothetical protein